MLMGCLLETQGGGSGILAVVYGCEMDDMSKPKAQSRKRKA